jgi:tellurite resistance protein
LFEAIVEAAYLVASADGAIEPPERAVLAKIVSAAAGNVVSSRHIDALLEELGGIVADEGVEARLARLPKRIRRVEHAHELLRVAALVALAHEGVSPVERAVLTRLALSLALGDADVDAAVASAEAALGAPDST